PRRGRRERVRARAQGEARGAGGRDADPSLRKGERAMSERPPANRRRKAAAVIEAPPDPIYQGDDSPMPGPATTTVPPRPRGKLTQTVKLTLGVAVVLTASVAVAWGARRYVTSSPRFSVRTVLVDGNKKRSANQVANGAGVAVGKN